MAHFRPKWQNWGSNWTWSYQMDALNLFWLRNIIRHILSPSTVIVLSNSRFQRSHNHHIGLASLTSFGSITENTLQSFWSISYSIFSGKSGFQTNFRNSTGIWPIFLSSLQFGNNHGLWIYIINLIWKSPGRRCLAPQNLAFPIVVLVKSRIFLKF